MTLALTDTYTGRGVGTAVQIDAAFAANGVAPAGFGALVVRYAALFDFKAEALAGQISEETGWLKNWWTYILLVAVSLVAPPTVASRRVSALGFTTVTASWILARPCGQLVKPLVVLAVYYQKILGSIVAPNLVAMMNMLLGKEPPADDLLHYKPMLADSTPAGNAAVHIPIAARAFLGFAVCCTKAIITEAGAKAGDRRMGGPDGKSLLAMVAEFHHAPFQHSVPMHTNEVVEAWPRAKSLTVGVEGVRLRQEWCTAVRARPFDQIRHSASVSVGEEVARA